MSHIASLTAKDKNGNYELDKPPPWVIVDNWLSLFLFDLIKAKGTIIIAIFYLHTKTTFLFSTLLP